MKCLPYSFASRHKMVFTEPDMLFYVDPLNLEVLEEVRRSLNVPFTLSVLNDSEFEPILTKVYQKDASEAQQIIENLSTDEDFFSLAEELPSNQDLLDTDDDAPIIKLINAMLSEAIKEGASDIHIETFETTLSIRFRIDGVLRDVLSPSRKLAPLLVSRVKVMGKLDIAEKRIPQDGRISLRIGGRAVDVRVSTMPSSHGERVVLRILDKNAAQLDLHSLGMTGSNHELFKSLIQRPHGVLLVTGPTGSGKSTTLYAGLQDLNYNEKNILTVEDPIEFDIDGIGQTQVNPKVDMTFARGLRAILRQDPDVVMVGEIRDLETAQIAVRASLTGHLVMSTLHTNTAIGAVTRLKDMGIESFLISSSLIGVLAQRLVRTLCPKCKESYLASDAQKVYFNIPSTEDVVLYKSIGCKHCNFKGYKGRTGIHELLIVDDNVKSLIQNDAGEMDIELCVRKNFPSIRHDGLEKVKQGVTTLEEIMRVTEES